MSADVFPQSKQGFGSVRVQLVESLADPEAPTLAEITAADGLDATPYFRADAFQISHEQGKIDDTRLSDDARRETMGISAYNVDTLVYIHNPQAAPDTPGNLMYDKAIPGSNQFLIVRYGIKSGNPFLAGQRIAVFSIQFGDQHQPIPVGDDSTHLINQPIAVSRETGDFKIAAA